ncbi:hypothetical protein Peur_005965 [Populus x canadensis]
MNVKQAYYLSMQCLQGRALLNAIGNLELSGAYADALRKLEDVAAGQVRYFYYIFFQSSWLITAYFMPSLQIYECDMKLDFLNSRYFFFCLRTNFSLIKIYLSKLLKRFVQYTNTTIQTKANC